MTAFQIAALIMLVGFALSAIATFRGDIGARLVAAQLSSTVTILITVLLSTTYGRDFYVDVALILVVMAVIGGLMFARFLERWL